MKKLTKILITSFILLSLIACNKNKLNQYQNTAYDVGFHTPFSIIAFMESQEEFDLLYNDLKSYIYSLHKLFDTFNNYDQLNNIKTINDNAGVKPVEVDKTIIDLLLLSKEYTEMTEKRFDPSLGAILKIWHEAREEGLILNRENKLGFSPDIEVLREAYNFVGWEFIEIDEVNNTVYITNENASLDVGAIAKGYAVELAALYMEEKGVKYGVVNGGGNVRTINTKADGSFWSVGITHPDQNFKGSALAVSFDSTMSIVTSGDYERYFVDQDNNHQHHLIHYKTLMPSTVTRSITVTTKDSTLADVLSTAFAMTPLSEVEHLLFLIDVDDIGLVYIFDDKQANDYGFNHIEVGEKHVYYNDVIKENLHNKK